MGCGKKEKGHLQRSRIINFKAGNIILPMGSSCFTPMPLPCCYVLLVRLVSELITVL